MRDASRGLFIIQLVASNHAEITAATISGCSSQKSTLRALILPARPVRTATLSARYIPLTICLIPFHIPPQTHTLFLIALFSF